MIKELKKGLYIDSWYDKYSRSYITQVKDAEDNELEYSYSGNKKDRDSDIKYFQEKYKNGRVQESLDKRKKLPALSTLNPISTNIIPNKGGAGIDSFNNASTTSSTNCAMGEALGDVVNYKRFNIDKISYVISYGDDDIGEVSSYIILAPVKSDTDLPLYCENESGEVQNFNTLQEAQDWIDKYENKFDLKIKNRNEIHAVINTNLTESNLDAIGDNIEARQYGWGHDVSVDSVHKDELDRYENSKINKIHPTDYKPNLYAIYSDVDGHIMNAPSKKEAEQLIRDFKHDDEIERPNEQITYTIKIR